MILLYAVRLLIYLQNNDGFIAYQKKTNPESQPGWVRGLVLFGAVLIEAVDATKCKVSWIWSFDINKKLAVKYKDEEPKKVALRLFKLKQKIEGDIKLAARTKEYEAQKNQGFDN